MERESLWPATMTSSIGSWRRSAALAAGFGAGLACPACEGGSGSGGGVGGVVDDDEAPLALVQFPPDGCLTDADLATLVIAASDASGVAFVRVAGLTAVPGSDGTWRVQVPLSEGANHFSVLAQDTRGNANPQAAELTLQRQGALWIEPSALAFDELVNEALVLDPASFALYGVDPASGRRTLRSGPGTGTGPQFQQPRDLDVVASRHAAVLTDGPRAEVVLVDLDTGSRAILSSSGIGEGPAPVDLHGIEVQDGLDRALVLDAGRRELLAVDLGTGERTTLSSATLGTGPALDQPRRLALDLFRGRVLVLQELSSAVLAIDLASGDRTVFTGGTVGTGPELQAPADLVVDPFQDRVLVVDRGALALFEVQLATGARRILSSSAQGLGPSWLGPVAVTRSLANLPLVLDAARDALLEVVDASGGRRIVTAVTLGSGPQFAQPAGLVVLSAGELGVADGGAVFSVAVASGTRALISGRERGVGPDFQRLDDLVGLSTVLCPHSLIVVDAELPGLWAVDAASGDRTLFSGAGAGSGPDFIRPRAITFEPTPRLGGCPLNLFVLDESSGGSGGTVLRVNSMTGERTILSDASRGTGPDFVAPVAIAPGDFGPVVLDVGIPALVDVDPVTGDRVATSLVPEDFVSGTDLGALSLVLTADPPGIWFVDPRFAVPIPVWSLLSGSGPAFGHPQAVALLSSETVGTVAPRPIAYVLDSARASVLVVDLSSGDRFLRTK